MILSLVACSHIEGDSRQLFVTIEPYRFVVEAVAGEEWNVRSIVSNGSNPETFDPMPSDLLALASSKAYFMVGGLGFENGWKEKIAELYPHLLLVDTSQGIERDEDDPHVWTSPDNISLIADNICGAMCRIDSLRANYYNKRLMQFKERLFETDSIVESKLQSCKGASFLIFHPSLTYFSNRYGLRQITVEHEGKEPSIMQMKSVVDAADEADVRCLFMQAGFDARSMQAVANELSIEIVEINPLSYDWHGEMIRIADALSLTDSKDD